MKRNEFKLRVFYLAGGEIKKLNALTNELTRLETLIKKVKENKEDYVPHLKQKYRVLSHSGKLSESSKYVDLVTELYSHSGSAYKHWNKNIVLTIQMRGER